MSQDLLVKNIRWLVTCNDAGEVLEHASMLVRNGVIVSIDPPGDVKADEVIDASGMILYPGMINAHHHLYQIFSRNLPQVQRMELFPWLKTLYEIWKNLEEESIYYSSMSGMGELLKTGCTTILDHHYVFPQGKSDRFLNVQFAAADELGSVYTR